MPTQVPVPPTHAAHMCRPIRRGTSAVTRLEQVQDFPVGHPPRHALQQFGVGEEVIVGNNEGIASAKCHVLAVWSKTDKARQRSRQPS